MFTFLSQIITLKGGRIALQLTPTLISSGPQKDCSTIHELFILLKQILGLSKTIMGFPNVSTSEYNVPKNVDVLTELTAHLYTVYVEEVRRWGGGVCTQ